MQGMYFVFNLVLGLVTTLSAAATLLTSNLNSQGKQMLSGVSSKGTGDGAAEKVLAGERRI
eukprot:5040875-Pyramimonas_sp.AAC.1